MSIIREKMVVKQQYKKEGNYDSYYLCYVGYLRYCAWRRIIIFDHLFLKALAAVFYGTL